MRMIEPGFEVTIGIDERCRGLDADARHARYVVGAVPAKRLHLDDLVRADTELFAYLRLRDRTIGHRVAHLYFVADELHQILVGGQNRYLRSGLDRVAGIRRDKVIWFEVRQLDLANIKRRCCSPHMRQLWAKILRHLPPVCFICVIYAIAETGT